MSNGVVELTGRWSGTVTGQEGVHVTNVSNGVRLRVDTKGRAGAGRTITLRP
ncbi:hypothetical protein ABIE67_009412 [Streptomyces sp. V4I8]|uniref:hypothetical protein n=1 Tax=Streptomyces sp. V4I8 TaxID=3156469 RepID=UPI0035149C5F